MNALIEEKRAELEALCAKYGVERLYLFGSAATGGFREGTSDLDFLVDMADREVPGYADRFLGLAEDLERLFGRRVDLVSERAIRNPIFLEEVVTTRQLIYGQAVEKAPA